MAEQRRQTRKDPDDHAPWKPAKWEIEDAGAIQALLRGDAAAHQQKRALDFIVERLAATYEQHYYPGPDGERNTSFALGRAFVGQQIVKLLKINLSRLQRKPSEQG